MESEKTKSTRDREATENLLLEVVRQVIARDGFEAAGYELQGSQWLKSYADDWFEAGFVEKLNQNSLSLRLGFAF